MPVQRCINLRVICICLLCQYCVVVSQRCPRLASFPCLALTKNSGTYYFEINTTLYWADKYPMSANTQQFCCVVGLMSCNVLQLVAVYLAFYGFDALLFEVTS